MSVTWLHYEALHIYFADNGGEGYIYSGYVLQLLFHLG